jgi:hypothetical protein
MGNKIKKLPKLPTIGKPIMFAFVLSFAAVGGYFVYKSFAAVPYKSATQYMNNTQVIKGIKYTGRNITLRSNGTVANLDSKTVYANRLNDGTAQDISFELFRSGKAFGKEWRTCVVARDLKFNGIDGEIHIKGEVGGSTGHSGGSQNYNRTIYPKEVYEPVCNSWRPLPDMPYQFITMTDLIVTRGVVRVHNARLEWR